MAIYNNDGFTTAYVANYTMSTSSTYWANTDVDIVDMSRENMANNKKSKKKQRELKNNFRSDLMTWITDNISPRPAGRQMLYHSPMYTTHNNALLKDFSMLSALGCSMLAVPASSHIVYDPYEGQRSYAVIFVDGVLEHISGIMAQALFLKKMMSKLNPEKRSYLILHTKTKDRVAKEAQRNNYPKDGAGYLVTFPDRKQARIEGIDDDEVKALIAYGRLRSILKTDTLSKIKGSHIILWNWHGA